MHAGARCCGYPRSEYPLLPVFERLSGWSCWHGRIYLNPSPLRRNCGQQRTQVMPGEGPWATRTALGWLAWPFVHTVTDAVAHEARLRLTAIGRGLEPPVHSRFFQSTSSGAGPPTMSRLEVSTVSICACLQLILLSSGCGAHLRQAPEE